MNRVVIHVDWKTHDEEGCITLTEKQDANRAILRLTDVHDVVFGVDCEPLGSEEEVDDGEVIVTLRDDIAISNLELITSHLAEHLGENLLKVERGEDDCTGASIKHGVDFTITNG